MASSDAEYQCFVGGLVWATYDRALEEAFSAYSKIVESNIINDCETGISKGFGFVTFKDEKAMRDVIEGMSGRNLDGRNILVNEAQSHSVGGGGGGDHGGGGYGGGDGGYGRRDGGGGGYGGCRKGGYGGGVGGYSRGCDDSYDSNRRS